MLLEKKFMERKMCFQVRVTPPKFNLLVQKSYKYTRILN